MENGGLFYGHLVYFKTIWYFLWQFGIFCGNSVYFVAIWYVLCQFDVLFLQFGIVCFPLVYQ
jgi:hypothetical protein